MSEKGLISATSKNLKSLKKSIESINDQVKKAGQRTVSDMKNQGTYFGKESCTRALQHQSLVHYKNRKIQKRNIGWSD